MNIHAFRQRSDRVADGIGLRIIFRHFSRRIIPQQGKPADTEMIGPGPPFGLTNATNVACTVALPNCTTATLVTGASAEQYLWADATRLAPGGQNLLASLAVLRAQRNPF